MTGMTIIVGFSHRLGAAAAAAHIIALTLQRLFSVLYQSFGIGTLTLVGRRFGAGQYEEARKTAYLFAWLVGAFVVCIAAATFLFARPFVELFTREPVVVSLCEKVLRVVAVIQIPKALSYVYTFSLRGIGQNRFPLYLSLVGVVAIELILGFNLAFTLGLSLIGIWAAAGIDESFKLAIAARRFQIRIRELSASAGG
jgi:Na+-driven multidrug efflux pump